MTYDESLFISESVLVEAVEYLKNRYKGSIKVDMKYAEGENYRGALITFNFDNEDVLFVDILIRERSGSLLVLTEDPKATPLTLGRHMVNEYIPERLQSYKGGAFTTMVDLVIDYIEDELGNVGIV